LAIDTLFERADMMDVECAERFCDWFSHHLSNFDFKWHWQKWYAAALPNSTAQAACIGLGTDCACVHHTTGRTFSR
jgi:hypothetical protein